MGAEREPEAGADYVAMYDQASAAVHAALRRAPSVFLFVAYDGSVADARAVMPEPGEWGELPLVFVAFGPADIVAGMGATAIVQGMSGGGVVVADPEGSS